MVRKIATLDVSKKDLVLTRQALEIVAGDGVNYQLIEAGTDVRTASVVILNGSSRRAKELWLRLRKWAPLESVFGIVLGVQSGSDIVVADKTIEQPIEIDSVTAVLKLIHARDRQSKCSKFANDEPPLIAINSRSRGGSSTPDEMMQLDGQVLIIDDSITVRRHLKFALSRFGLDVETADSGDAGLKQLFSARYDLVFLDVVMPGTNGFEVCKKIKATPGLRELPIVMLTSKSSPFDKVRGALSGCDSYLTKPVELSQLQDALKKYMAPGAQCENSVDSFAETVVIDKIDNKVQAS